MQIFSTALLSIAISDETRTNTGKQLVLILESTHNAQTERGGERTVKCTVREINAYSLCVVALCTAAAMAHCLRQWTRRQTGVHSTDHW